MRKLLLMFTAMASLALAQSQPGNSAVKQNNDWGPAVTTLPVDGQAAVEWCAFLKDVNGNPVRYLPGVQLNMSTYTTQGSGAHPHETSPGMGRPQAFLLPAGLNNTVTTGPDGCVVTTWQLPGFAGWYTMESHASNYLDPATGRLLQIPPTGINYWAQYLGEDGVFAGVMTAYPNNVQYNVDQNYAPDNSHNNNVRNLGSLVIPKVQNASAVYNTNVYADIGYFDLVNVVRGSLPFGGALDNDGLGYWRTYPWEWHHLGTEVDVINPMVAQPLNSYVALSAVAGADLFNAFAVEQCNLGIHSPFSSNNAIFGSPNLQPDPSTFWKAMTWMHFVCYPGARAMRYFNGTWYRANGR